MIMVFRMKEGFKTEMEGIKSVVCGCIRGLTCVLWVGISYWSSLVQANSIERGVAIIRGVQYFCKGTFR